VSGMLTDDTLKHGRHTTSPRGLSPTPRTNPNPKHDGKADTLISLTETGIRTDNKLGHR
jgi:hypothetical protein